MPKIKNSLLTDVDNFAGLSRQTYSNISLGGQLGVGSDLPNIDAATPLLFPNSIVIVTHTPTMFESVPYANEIIVSLVEKHAQNITGISPTLTMGETDGYVLNNKTTVKMFGSSSYDDLAPSFTWRELNGNLIYKLINTWINMMSHSETGYSNLAATLGLNHIEPLVYSTFCMDICVIQPDITLMPENIIDAFFISNCFPKTVGELGSKREVGSDSETKERTVEFTGTLQKSANTHIAGQMILKLLNLHKANFDLATPLTEKISDTISGTAGSMTNQIKNIVKSFK